MLKKKENRQGAKCYDCNKTIAYINLGPWGANSFDPTPEATLMHIVGNAWVIACPCGCRTKFTAIGRDKNGKLL